MTVQYTLRVGAGFTIQFFQFLYSMFRCISVYGYDTGHTSRLLIFDEWEHGGGIYADDASLFLVAGPYDNWYFYQQNTQNFGIPLCDCRPLFEPVDIIAFNGLGSGKIESITFCEIKTGKARLNPRERMVKEAVEDGRVDYRVMK